jgi:Fe-Mn family superoxide dismutase
MTAQAQTQNTSPTFVFFDLPYAKNALEPHISTQTMELHHGKHYKAYIDKANELCKSTPIEGMALEKAVVESFKQGGPLFNNIGQAYNHYVFWLCMKPNGGGQPTGALAEQINKDFGSFDTFKEQFVNTGLSQFGSGWVWLSAGAGGKLEIGKSANGESPLLQGKTPLIGCDVWEHAYYLDYQNRRADYLKAFVANLINWDYASKAWDKTK